jgi:hypothetical protein
MRIVGSRIQNRFCALKETIGLWLGYAADDVVAQLGQPEEKWMAKILCADKMEHNIFITLLRLGLEC